MPGLLWEYQDYQDYQDKMESTLVEMRKINSLISGLAGTDRGNGKQKEAPGPSAACRTPEPQRQVEQQEAAARNPEEPRAEEEEGWSSKRSHTTGEGSASKGTSDPIAKQTRAGTSNPEGSAASPVGAEKPSQPPQAGCHEEGEEYDLRRTCGRSAASPLGVSK